MSATSPHDAGVEPWVLLGYLKAELEHAGTITPEAWERAIADCVPMAKQVQVLWPHPYETAPD